MKRLLAALFSVFVAGCTCVHPQTQKTEKVCGIATLPLFGSNLANFKTFRFTTVKCQDCKAWVGGCSELLAIREATSGNSLCPKCQRSPHLSGGGSCEKCPKSTSSEVFTLCPQCALFSDICARCKESLSDQPPEDPNASCLFTICFKGTETSDPKLPWEKRLDIREAWLLGQVAQFEDWLKTQDLNNVKTRTVMVATRMVIIGCSPNEAKLIQNAPQIEFICRCD